MIRAHFLEIAKTPSLVVECNILSVKAALMLAVAFEKITSLSRPPYQS